MKIAQLGELKSSVVTTFEKELPAVMESDATIAPPEVKPPV